MNAHLRQRLAAGEADILEDRVSRLHRKRGLRAGDGGHRGYGACGAGGEQKRSKQGRTAFMGVSLGMKGGPTSTDAPSACTLQPD